MYGTTTKEMPKAKGESENRQRLCAVFELKKQLEEFKSTVTNTQENAETLKKISAVESDIGAVTRMVSKMQTQMDDMQEKQDAQITELYESIEQYITTATPRCAPDLEDIKQKLQNVESKLEKIDKKDQSSPIDDKPKTKLVRPPSRA